MRHRREAERPVADERSRSRAEQRIAPESLVEARGVVVEREHEAGVRDACLGRAPGRRRGRRAAATPSPSTPSASGAVPGAAAAHQAEAVRAGRGDDVLEHVRLTRICPGRSAAAARYLRPDEARRRRLAPLAPEEAPALPRRDAPDGRDDRARRRRRRGRLRRRRRPVGLRARTTSSRSSIRGRRGSRPLGLHDGAGFRSRYPEIAVRARATRCALPFADQRVRRRASRTR